MALGQTAPSFSAFAAARGAAPRVYEIIDRQSSIDPLSDSGDILPAVHGKIRFEDVTFNYKSRCIQGGEPALRNLCLEISAGSTHALVGPSGCGKSSTMNLIERFYDPNQGRVTIDGVNIRDLNVRWLRSQMGYVGQMPTLFRATIRENIAFGSAMDVMPHDAADQNNSSYGELNRREVPLEDVVAAAKLANAHVFITKLPEGYDTMLGERGALLSGGQKQRICIARAIVRNPKILLLDESTSALDAQSERIVQDALERAAEGRTTILIAHRLSTVRNADKISVFKDGVIVEGGRHDELMQRPEGAYRQLVELQEVHSPVQNPASRTSEYAKLEAAEITKADSASVARKLTEHQASVAEAQNNETKPPVDKGVIARAFKLNKVEFPFIALGVFGAALYGAAWPVSAYVFSNVTVILTEKDNQGKVRFWVLMFVVIGAISFLGGFLQLAMLGVSGERLTRKLRSRAFRALLRQEMGFFDRKENAVGSLSTRLATEATLVKGITGDTLGAAALAISTIFVGFTISFTGCWRLALVLSAVFPLMAISSIFQVKFLSGFDASAKKDFAASGAIASEAVDNIRTVTGLGIQDYWLNRYGESLLPPLKKGSKTALLTGIAFGFSEVTMFGLWAIAFWVGAKFIANGQCTFLGLMKTVTSILFAGLSLGNIAMFVPDIAAAVVAATNIFRLLDRESRMDSLCQAGRRFENMCGQVDFREAEFEYPSRADVAVIRGLNLSVAPGKTLALVGQSGCGKSTVVSLLERFYDVRSGSLKIDNEELRDCNLQNVRSYMALVQQEPDLFNRSVKENILYGLSHEEGIPVTDEQVVDAAKAANAHEFISKLPLGYDAPVGERGSGLSGGQRQRVAIARSLARCPRILLLDEATSALDARSEQVVQDALDVARMGRTTILIAHRLSTVKDADAIALVSRGKIAELGTHAELMAKGGGYADLVRNQLTEEL
jgi:ABC-type multidrug transport system fused ATPase/permease subunit